MGRLRWLGEAGEVWGCDPEVLQCRFTHPPTHLHEARCRRRSLQGGDGGARGPCLHTLLNQPPPSPHNQPYRRSLQGGDGGVCGAGDGGAAAARRAQPPHAGLPVARGASGVAQAIHRRLHQVRGGGGQGGWGAGNRPCWQLPILPAWGAASTCSFHSPTHTRTLPSPTTTAGLYAGTWRRRACVLCWRCPSPLSASTLRRWRRLTASTGEAAVGQLLGSWGEAELAGSGPKGSVGMGWHIERHWKRLAARIGEAGRLAGDGLGAGWITGAAATLPHFHGVGGGPQLLPAS